MTLRIHDTRGGKKVAFEPLRNGEVGIYSCGITVYDLCHVGHARMLVAFDVIVRHLRASGLEVRTLLIAEEAADAGGVTVLQPGKVEAGLAALR